MRCRRMERIECICECVGYTLRLDEFDEIQRCETEVWIACYKNTALKKKYGRKK